MVGYLSVHIRGLLQAEQHMVVSPPKWGQSLDANVELMTEFDFPTPFFTERPWPGALSQPPCGVE
jgi:hypothetical protein